MKSNLQILLEEFLPQEEIDPILDRANEMSLTVKVKQKKGRWHRETLRKLVKERGNACNECHAAGDADKLTLDHIIPKSMLLDMGLDEFFDDESNLEILCIRCNIKKGSKLDFTNPKTISQLEKYIGLYKERHGISKPYGDHIKESDNGPGTYPVQDSSQV